MYFQIDAPPIRRGLWRGFAVQIGLHFGGGGLQISGDVGAISDLLPEHTQDPAALGRIIDPFNRPAFSIFHAVQAGLGIDKSHTF